MTQTTLEKYDQTFFNSRFANRIYGDTRTIRIGNVVSFLAPVDLPNLNATEVMNFCAEIPDISIYAGACFQRLWITNMANILGSGYVQSPIEVINTDIVIKQEHTQCGIKQLDGIVSMTHLKAVSNAILIHVGLYNNAGETAPPRSFSLKFDNKKATEVMNAINENFYHLANTIFLATTKV